MKSAEDISRLSLGAKRALAAELLRKKVKESKSAYPLSKGQQALWFQHQLAPAAYNVTFAARILGDLNVEALRGSFEKLVERHALLRTEFGTVDGRPLQRVTAGGSLDFRFVEMSNRDQAEIDRAIGEEARCPFDLERGGLLRVRLFSRAPEENILLLTIHHIIGDFWSLVILIEELRLLYPGEKLGRRSHLPRLDCEYRDYVKWQESLITGSRGEELWEYWRKELAGDLQQLEIPIDKPRPPVQTYRGASYIFNLGSELTSHIKALAIQADVTPYVVLLAAFNLLLHRYTGQQDILSGSIATGRSHPQFESIFGYFANPLVLRSDLSGNPSFLELCERVRRKVLGAVENEDYPFPLLVERLKPNREASSSPIFNTMFLFEKAHRFEAQGAALFIMGRAGARISLDDLVLESINLEQQAVQFDLTLMMEEANGVFTGSLQYNEDLFKEERIERMGEHLRRVLEEVGKNGELRIGSVKYLSEGEVERLVREWNETRREYGEESVQEMIEKEARERGDAVAVRCGEEQMSYREMNERGNKLGRMLRRRGVREESLVGICVERSVEMMVGLIGIMKSGGAYIPIDPGFPVERVEYMLEDGKAEVIVTEKRLASVVRGGGRKLMLIDEEWEEIEREGGEDFGVVGREENLMYVMYTSGSTGRPKGVGIERGSVTNLLKTMKERPGMGEEEVMVAVTTISFDIAGLELYLPLIGGGQVVVMRREEATDVEELKEGIRKNGATIMQGTPATWRMLVEGGWEGEEGLKVLCGGEALGEELAGELKRRGLELWNMYGPTETTIWSAIEEVEEGRGIGIGRPIGNTEIYLLDEYGELCGEGIAGEMYIGGKGVGRGYIGRGDLTGERFVPDGVSGGEGKRMYRTGDVCRYREGGRIEYEGRRDEQVKVRGYRIEIGEVERVLEEDERVSKAVVVLRDSEVGGKHLVAYIVPRAEHSFSNARLRDSLRQRLPEYMLPAAFVPIDELPLTPNGKINRRALPVPDGNSIQSEEFVGPRSPEEELLAAIWSQLLGISRIGVDKSFFALGGHSLLATQLVSRIEEVFHLRIPLATVFEAPTIARMADRLQSLSGSGALVRSAPIERCSRSEELPLSFAQQRLWFLDQFERGSPFYNVPAAFQLTGRVNVPALEASLSETVRRHESLRTVFEAAGGRPAQTITPAKPIVLQLIDLSSLGAHERRSRSESLSSRHARRVFDLARGPLLRVCLLKLAAEEHVLLINIHHIVFDGWSAGIFVRELASVHEAARGGWACSLSEPVLQCADFAAWQRQWLKGEVLDSQLDYWKQQLGGDLPPLELPTDHPRPPVMTYRGARKSFLLSAELTESLKALSRKRGVTLFMTLLAGFLSLLHRYTGQLDIRVGSSIANRNRGELEGIIGFFVNTIVLRAGFSGNPSFAELLNEVRRAALEAYANQDLPFERLVEELHPERDLGRSPIFQTMYIHQNAPAPPLTLSELAVSQTAVDSGTSMFDLTLFTEETPDGISGSLQYNEDLFKEERIERMGEHLRRVLEEVGKNGELRIGSVKYLSEGEVERLVREWNETRREYGEESVQEMIEREARERGDAVAVRCGEEQMSYREMNERGNKLGRMLRRRGVREESLVGICVERSVEMMVGLIGIMKSGGAYIPIDPGFPVERVEYMLEDGKAEVIVTEKRLASVVRGGGRKLVLIDEEWEEIEREGGEDFGVVGREENLMYVMYTSGSTGRPKGVGIERGSVTNLLKTMKERPGMGEEEVMVAVTTISFDIAGLELYLPLIGGGQVVVMRREEATDVEELKEGIRKNGATIMQGTPATWRMLVEGGWEGEEGLKVLCGGEALGEELAGELKRRGLELWNMYGPTETTIWSAIEEVEEGRGIGIGRPIGNTEIYLLDEYGELCGEGIAGEMYIGGKGVGRGYIGRGDLTGERFVPDGVSGGEGKRMYRTGDVCRYREGGRIEYEGRRDEQVKVRGYRIEIGEVERVLEEDERVSKAVVVLRDSEVGGKHLVAYIVPNRHYLSSQQEDTNRAEQIDHTAQWQGLWDETYSQAPPHPDHTFNTSGWNSSYTGAPIAADEMREWVDSTVARILALNPRAALEVGCGTGLLLFRIAPHCDRYVGTDFSETAIGYIARELSELEQPPPSNISVMLKSADGLGDFEERSFDTVILNSVVQYFPGVDYLVQVLTQAVDLVESGGAVFLGDVRNLTLLEPFHASVLASQSPKSLPASELKRRLRTRVAQEEELLLDPQFFMALCPQLPRVSRVEIQLKRGRNLNELIQFRYDVVLHIGASEERPSEGATLDWINDRFELSTLRDCLERTQPRSLTVTQIPNGRISDAVSLVELLGREAPPATLGELAEALESSICRNDVEPEDIWQLGEELPYGVEVRWSRSGNPVCFDAVFTRRAPGGAAESLQGEHRVIRYKPLSAYANNPLSSRLSRKLVPEMRSRLKAKLPDYMIPSTFELLDSLPLTPNGKVDRRALPDTRTAESTRTDIRPKSGLEQTIAAVWQQVLQLDSVSVNANFFDLGGHSLSMAQVRSRLRDEFNIDLSMVELFRYPTINSLSKYLSGNNGEQPDLAARTSTAATGRSVGRDSQIAIIGMAGRFPGAENVPQFWENIRTGVESITFFSDSDLLRNGVSNATLNDSNYVKAGSVLDGVEMFDARFFGFSAREAEFLDPQHRVLLECASEALDDAGYDPNTYNGAIGVFAGASLNTYLFNLLPEDGLASSPDAFQILIGNDKDYLATRISYKLNLHGPSVSVQTACSTSLVAVHLGCQSLLSGESDMVLAGGVSVRTPQMRGYFYEAGGVLSPDGHCRAFDAKALGTVFGSGAGIVVLKMLEKAIADGDHIYAVLKGSAINNDGALKAGYTAPNVDFQAAAIRKALNAAGVDPATIGYVETHGTGTALGDPIEIAALSQAFRGASAGKQFCAIGSVKSNIGHLDAAAGVAGLIKTALALNQGVLPPSLNFEDPNPQIDFDEGPFYVNTTSTHWKTDQGPRRAGVSSFGIGGTNAHVILEEPPRAAKSAEPDSAQPILISARTGSALESLTGRLAAHLKHHRNLNLADVAYTLQAGRRPFQHRRMVLCRTIDEAVAALETRDPTRMLTRHLEHSEPSAVFLFPGQGSQYSNMGRGLYTTCPEFRNHIDACSETLRDVSGFDLRTILYPEGTDIQSAEDSLGQTSVTQPVLFVVEYALAKLLEEWGVRPRAMAGHSIGEYVAACLSGVFSLEDGLRVVAARGRLMQSLPPGAMLSVHLSEHALREFLNAELSLAAVNSPSMTVASGPPEAIEELEERLKGENVGCRRLPVSHAFHSRMMDPIVAEFSREVRKVALNSPTIPYLSNVTGQWISADEATSPDYWATHMRREVRFGAGASELLKLPIAVFLEVGPGKSLLAAVNQQSDNKPFRPAIPLMRHARDHSNDIDVLSKALGLLWLEGVQPDWRAVHSRERRRRVSLPGYPFERQRYWIEATGRLSGVVRTEVDLAESPSDPATKSNGAHDAVSGENANQHASAPLHGRPALSTAYRPPASGLEAALVEIWQDLLGISPVGIHDDFFDLGGHSLLAARVMSRVREVFQVDLTVPLIFEASTVEQMLMRIAEKQMESLEYHEIARILEEARDLREGATPEPSSYTASRVSS